MPGDFDKPSGDSEQANFMAEIRDNDADIAKMLYSGTANLPDGVVRRNPSTKRFEVYTLATTSWGPLDISETTIALAANATTCGGKTPAAASGLATLNASSKVVQEPASKGVASGIPSLNEAAKVIETALLADSAAACSGNAATATVATNALMVKDLGLGFSHGLFGISLGQWNMDTTASITVAHGLSGMGLSVTQVRGVFGMLRNDANSLYLPITSGLITSASEIECWVSSIDNTNITINRKTGGVFDSVDYDSTALSRGSLTLIIGI